MHNWDLQIDKLLCKGSKAVVVVYIFLEFASIMVTVRINLAHYLIVLSCPCCLYGIEVWGSAYKDKYLSHIDRFCKRAFKFGYTTKYILISDVIANRNDKMWKRITCNPNHSLYDLYLQNEGKYCVNVGMNLFSQK